jgi:hypothetical protein
MGSGDDYGGLQQPAGGYAGAGGANDPTGYGDVQNPPSPYGKGTVAAPVTDLITQVKSDLAAINVSLEGADLKDMQSHRNHAEFEKIDFVAWTNSSKDVYVNLLPLRAAQQDPDTGPKNARAAALVSVRHEIYHVIQFKNNGGPPKSFKDMITFESEAYSKTLKWMDDGKTNTYLTKTIGATSKFLEGVVRAQFADEGTKFAGRTKVKASEQDHRTWLIDNGFLPKTIQGNENYTISDLYQAS